ncbi:MAG TPA: hypothetical protein VFY96_05365, partial [Candidatus Binatia bacterium]|nr:hypothetical protein [Candidatus Binatia bacterium]
MKRYDAVLTTINMGPIATAALPLPLDRRSRIGHCTWMQNVGAAWLMTSLAPSPTMGGAGGYHPAWISPVSLCRCF